MLTEKLQENLAMFERAIAGGGNLYHSERQKCGFSGVYLYKHGGFMGKRKTTW
jgi:hypothetical protein